MATMTRHQLRAARALLLLQQEVLAEMADVSVVSIRRFENGNEVGAVIVEALHRAIVAAGGVLVASGSLVDGRSVGEGVVLATGAQLPEETKHRLSKLDLSSKVAVTRISGMKKDGVGRRVRVLVPTHLRKPADEGEPSKS